MNPVRPPEPLDTGALGAHAFAGEATDVGPASTVAGIDEQELAVLRQVGDHWGQVLARAHRGRERYRSIPV